MPKILIAVLVLTTLVPAKLGLICLFSQLDALDFFGLATLSPDVENLFIILGCFILATVAFQIVAIVWLIKGKPEGFSLSAMVALIAIGRGIMMFVLLRAHNSTDLRISVAPIVFGALILILTIVAGKKESQ